MQAKCIYHMLNLVILSAFTVMVIYFPRIATYLFDEFSPAIVLIRFACHAFFSEYVNVQLQLEHSMSEL